ncbi:MAG: hypothetical protein AAGH83_03375 [Pseudomonadota bacterium]
MSMGCIVAIFCGGSQSFGLRCFFGIAAVSLLISCDQTIDAPPPIQGDNGALFVNGDTASPFTNTPTTIPSGTAAFSSQAGIPRKEIRLLPNNTSLPGDNVIVSEPINSASGTISPTSRLSDFPSSLDAFGPSNTWRFKTVSNGATPVSVVTAEPLPGVVCVAATRTGAGFGLGTGINAGITATTLRNCVTGTEEQALSPLFTGISG